MLLYRKEHARNYLFNYLFIYLFIYLFYLFSYYVVVKELLQKMKNNKLLKHLIKISLMSIKI